MATILDLLMALNRGELPPVPMPAPSRPIMPDDMLGPGGFRPPSPGPMPGPAPMVAAPPLDEALISRIAGAEPVAPTFQAPGTLEKIATLLSGLGAGFQGQGPQFAESVRERRERPMREYEGKRQIYEQRKLRGVEAAEEKQMREQAALQRRAEIQSNREFEVWARRAHITEEDAKIQARQAWELQKIREQERIADERLERHVQAKRDEDARKFEHELATKDDAPGPIAKEIAEYTVGKRPALSAAAEKWRGLRAEKLRAQIARLERVGTGGGGVSSKALKLAQEIQDTKDRMVEAEARGDTQTVKQLHTKAKALIRSSARYPEIEAGFGSDGKWPYVKTRTPQGSTALPGVAQTAAPQGQQNDPLGIR